VSTYVIGDVQGCFQQLKRLLTLLQFDAKKDVLWFTGDLVNRGPDSLSVLRFISSLGEKHISVLGNHDLHLLAVARGDASLHPKDTLQAILEAPDCDALLNWLIHRPLLHYDATFNAVLTHAGLAPSWSLDKAVLLASEVENILQNADASSFLKVIYGNQPDLWSDELAGFERARCIVNYFTRMRVCDEDGRLDFIFNGDLSKLPPALYPWYRVPNRLAQNVDSYFGHWAALNGQVDVPHVYALDTGCVWGNQLTAMCIETKERFSVDY
jgi:bis(5'-nucleosyl)-tetraphosphatase (symmetrical)